MSEDRKILKSGQKTPKKHTKSVTKTLKTNEKVQKKDENTSNSPTKVAKNIKKVAKTNPKTKKTSPKIKKKSNKLRKLTKLEIELLEETIQFMMELNIYKPQYKRTIELYASLLFLYDKLYREFENSGYKVTEFQTNKAGFTNERKTGLYLSIEKLREEIFRTQHILGIVPHSLKKLIDSISEKQESKLTNVLQNLWGKNGQTKN